VWIVDSFVTRARDNESPASYWGVSLPYEPRIRSMLTSVLAWAKSMER
jgi:hypothetical protein